MKTMKMLFLSSCFLVLACTLASGQTASVARLYNVKGEVSILRDGEEKATPVPTDAECSKNPDSDDCKNLAEIRTLFPEDTVIVNEESSARLKYNCTPDVEPQEFALENDDGEYIVKDMAQECTGGADSPYFVRLRTELGVSLVIGENSRSLEYYSEYTPDPDDPDQYVLEFYILQLDVYENVWFFLLPREIDMEKFITQDTHKMLNSRIKMGKSDADLSEGFPKYSIKIMELLEDSESLINTFGSSLKYPEDSNLISVAQALQYMRGELTVDKLGDEIKVLPAVMFIFAFDSDLKGSISGMSFEILNADIELMNVDGKIQTNLVLYPLSKI